jgi:hypothetical protein
MLVFIRFIFFFRFNLLNLYIFFELSLIPIIIIRLIFGIQIEKINSIYYLLLYSFLTSFPFLFLIFYSDVFDFFFYYYNFSYDLIFFMIIIFLVKFPIYFLHY